VRGDWIKQLRPLGITILILVVLEIISTALIPMMGLTKYRIPFNVLIVLYMGLKLETPYTSLIILALQYTHSFFSIEGWEMGTIAGVLICVIISYLKDLLHLSSSVITIFIVQMFQFVWFFIVSALLYLKEESFSFILEKFWRFLPESILLSILAPFFFGVLDAIWRSEENRSLGESL